MMEKAPRIPSQQDFQGENWNATEIYVYLCECPAILAFKTWTIILVVRERRKKCKLFIPFFKIYSYCKTQNGQSFFFFFNLPDTKLAKGNDRRESDPFIQSSVNFIYLTCLKSISTSAFVSEKALWVAGRNAAQAYEKSSFLPLILSLSIPTTSTAPSSFLTSALHSGTANRLLGRLSMSSIHSSTVNHQ